jgi:choice-of-anchor A domain-containing protein
MHTLSTLSLMALPLLLVAWPHSPSPVVYAPSPSPSPGCPPFPFNPWQLNVIVFGDIGSASKVRGADCEGAAAALGSVWYQSFSVDGVATSSPTNIGHYVGRNMTLNSGSIGKGGLEVAGTLYLSNIAVNGPVSVGGDMLTGTGGSSVKGNLLVAGACPWCQSQQNAVSPGYTETIGGTFNPTLNLARLQSYYQCISQWVGSSSDCTTYSNSNGNITINLAPGTTRNYVTIPSSVLTASYAINIYGTSTQELIVNVKDSAVTLGNFLIWSVFHGIRISNVLLNMPNAVTLTITSGGAVSLLAPFAVTTFDNGVTTGNFIVKQLIGGNGQINDGFYCTISFPLTCPNEACGGSTVVDISAPASPSASPIAFPSASPSPSANTCSGLNTTFPNVTICGCSESFFETVVTTYNCTPIGQGCNSWFCTISIPQDVYTQLEQCLTA